MSMVEAVKNAIEQSGNTGITCKELQERFKVSAANIYSTVHMIKKKNMLPGYTAKKGHYSVREKIHCEVQNSSEQEGVIINKKLLSRLAKLEENDKADFLELWRKAEFHRRTAEALLETAELKQKMGDEIA